MNNESIPRPEQTSTYTSPDNAFVDEFRSNIKSDLIMITADKLENILLKHIKNLEILKAWLTPLSLFIALVLACVTATFSNKLGLDGAVWQALFILGAFVSALWFIYAIIKMCLCWNKCSLEHLIGIIKNAQTTVSSPEKLKKE